MRIWDKYLKCKEYAEKKRITQNVNEQWNFYNDKQWEGLESGGEILPFFNFIKPITRYKVATVCSNNMTANYSDLQSRPEYEEVYKKLNEDFAANWERANMDRQSWLAVKIAAIEGDSYTYFGDESMKDVDVLGETEVLFGDEQCSDIQTQPYIIIRERLDVKDIRKIAEENGLPREEIDSIVSDRENEYLVGNKDDVDDDAKATALVYYERIDGVVHMARAVQTCEFVPLHPIKYTVGGDYEGAGLTYYPFVKFQWENQPNNARGCSEVRSHIPNQIKENQVLAQRAIAVAQCSYPKMAYDSTAVMNPEAIDTIGGIIEVQGGIGKVNDMVGYLNPATISNDSAALSTDLREVTRELAGASETTLGQIDPTRVAASAIAALKDSSAVNINEQVSGFKQYVEDIARLWIPLQIVYAPQKLEELFADVNSANAAQGIPPIQLSDLEKLEPDIRVDVSQDTPWTKEARQQTLDNLLQQQQITFEEYVQLLPENSIVPKNELLKVMAKRQLQQQEMAQQAEQQEIAQQQMAQMPPEEPPEEEE